jgi:hypothetical protein
MKGQIFMKRLKKMIVFSVMVMTVLSMSVVVAPQASAASAGDLIKMDGLSSVYYLGADGKRYVFPNESTYFSWYNDFSGVVTIAQSELESYPLGKNVTVRPGTKLIKITTNPNVYAVTPGGNLLLIPTEEVAAVLYGEAWASRVVDIADSFFTNYEIVAGEASVTTYPAGSLVKFGSTDVYYIDADGMARLVADEAAFAANKFSFNYVIDSILNVPSMGADITVREDALSDTAQGAGGVAGAGTGVSFALAANTSPSQNIPAGSPADFMTLNITAANDGDVSVNSITVTGYDLGNSENIDSVTFYDNGVKVGTSKNLNSDRVAVFNFAPAISVPAGTTKSLVVRATILSSATGNYSIGIASASDILTNGAVVSGSFPVVGNTKAIATGTNIGTMTISAVTASTPSAEFGEDNVLVSEFNLSATNEDVFFNSLRLRNGGTNDNALASNLLMFVDGTEVAQGTYADRYATFALENVIVKKGDTVTVQIYADMGIGSVGNTFSLYLKDVNDMVFTGKTYGFGIQMTDPLDYAEGVAVTLSAGDVTLDMDKAASPSQDVRPGTDNVVLATFSVVSNAENATINYIKDANGDEFIIAGTGLDLNEIENVELRDVNTGVIYDTTIAAGVASNTVAMTFDEEMSLLKGVKRTFEVRADLKGSNDTYPIDDDDTLAVTIEDGAFSITGLVSDAELNGEITPTSVTGSVTTVKTASLIWTTTALTNKTFVPGAVDELIYRATAKAGTASDVTLTSVKLNADTYAAFKDGNISALELFADGVSVKNLAGQITDDAAATAAINFTSLNVNIPAGEDVTFTVLASFPGTFETAGDFSLEITDAATSIIVKNEDNDAFAETVSNAGTDSRLIFLASTGTLKVEMKVDDLKANDNTYIVAGSATDADRYLGELVFTTTNEDVKVKTLALGQTGTSESDDVLGVQLFDESGVAVAEADVDAYGNAYFDTLNLVMRADQTTSLYIGVVTKSINADGDAQGTADHGETIIFNLASSTDLTLLGLSANKAVTAIGDTSGQDIAIVEDDDGALAVGEYSLPTVVSKTSTIAGSKLTSIVSTLSDGTLSDGLNRTIAKYKFVFDNGMNRSSLNEALKAQLETLALAVSTSTATVVDIQAYVEGASANKTTAVQTTAGVATINLSAGLLDSSLVDGEVTLVIIGDVSGSGTTGSVSTAINDLAGGDVQYYGNGVAGGTLITNPLLDITDVTGATLSK